jgi:hypothetical protein
MMPTGTISGGVYDPYTNGDIVTLMREGFSRNFLEKSQIKYNPLAEMLYFQETIDPMEYEKWVDGIKPLSSTDSNIPAEVTSRRATTSYTDTLFYKRKITTTQYNRFELLQAREAKSRLLNPRERIIENTINYFNRMEYEEAITALLGTAVEGYRNTSQVWTTSNETLDSTHILTDDANEGFTYDRFLDIEEAFRNDEVNFDEEKWVLLIGPRQNKQAKKTDMFINKDYVGETVLANGTKLPKLNNATIMVTSLLPTTGNYRRCVAFTLQGLIRAVEEAWELDVQVATAYQHNISVKMERSFGYVRSDEDRVVEFQCFEGGSVTA